MREELRLTKYPDKRVGVVLAGCGVYDGTEIHEAVLTLLFLAKAEAQVICLAPGKPQHHVIDHLSGQVVATETRGMLAEGARIARGSIMDMHNISAADLDGLIFPGGYGAAKNLSDFAFKGWNCTVEPETERLIREMHAAGKPLGFICIAPVVAAKVLGEYSPLLTIGSDPETSAAIESMGGKHVNRKVDDIAVDEKNKVVSSPAYMLGPGISDVTSGIEKLVWKVLELS
ncbi:MAG TPA: isoprenoid biosynthesis glyoxalase ElbB [Candidatus Limnocylindrales bacterium]|nr:isoprenoid biosynthesis glyoxalase ElbB [Candidatus Limnocylindrales bacterium]